MGTITVNLDDGIEKEFRTVAVETFGKGKGHLGKALAEALQNWVYERKQERTARTGKEIMRHGNAFGKRLYEQRADLHER